MAPRPNSRRLKFLLRERGQHPHAQVGPCPWPGLADDVHIRVVHGDIFGHVHCGVASKPEVISGQKS